ncbi:MAG: 3-deoxy-manno-octulosonate cytidylyltransferase (CMP-KDO synthetase), partial [Candidatus Azotimanducaceae bacterium]
MSSPFTVVIPARFASQRLPGKPLIDLAGKPMIQRVYEQALLSRASRVVVATDDQRIADVVKSFDGEYCMTRVGHVSGTDRVQEVTSVLGLPLDHLVINVQGDEPLIPPEVINQVADILEGSAAPMATLAEPIETLEDLMDPNIVKVVTAENGDALYFSRAPIPWDRDSLP